MDHRKKIAGRNRRLKKTRGHIKRLKQIRLSVHRTGQHMYAQVFSVDGSQVIASASTVEKAVAESIKATSNIDAAKAVGKLVGERAIAAGVKSLAFDRSGFKYHGRIKALADAARESGLKF
jgi:large subunit ribosomal protein L18